MRKNSPVIGFVFIILLSLCIAVPAIAQQTKSSRTVAIETDDEVYINFDDVDIRKVIDGMSQTTGKNFLVDKAVKGKVTVIAPKPVPKDEAYSIFESILELNGFSLVPMGNIIKVMPSKSATQKDIPVGKGRESKQIQRRDQLITQLIPIKYTDAQAIVSVLQPLISSSASITAYSNTNTVILTETSSNIKRLLLIVQEIDVPGFEETITIIPLVNAQADILAQEILQALESAPGSAPGTPRPRPRRGRQAQAASTVAATSQIKIIPDLRTNSLIVVANELDTEQVRFLVGELDKTTPVEANNIHVYRLENALAEEIAAVLKSLATTATPAGGKGAGASAISGVRTFYKEVSLVADKTTNSLIITATPQDFTVLKRVIEQLDVMRPQVLVETLIAEVSLDLTRKIGVQWLAANPRGEDHGFIGVNEGGGALASEVAETLVDPTKIVPAIPAGISAGYFNFDGEFLKAFIEANASESDSDFNVLSAPHVLTLDNEKAVINISDNVPFITSRLTDDTGGATLAQSETFEYRDVGIVLEITPHISPERMVRLEIKQQVNDVSQVTSGISKGALSEKKREAETTVMVKDRNTLVLGGLMKDTEDITVNKVPILGDIPLLGWLFKSKSTSRGKKNLLIFITPNIVTNATEATRLRQEKTEDVSERLREQIEQSTPIHDGENSDETPDLVDNSSEGEDPK